MKQNGIYIIPLFSLSQRSNENNFKQFTDEDFSFLKLTLYLNLLENANQRKDKVDIIKVLDNSDKDFFSNEFDDESTKTIFYEIKDLKILLKELLNKDFISHKNNLLIFSDAIDIRPVDIDKYFNLLSMDDKSIVIATSNDRKIKVFGFNSYSDDLIKYISDSDFFMDKFLSYNKSCEYFVNTVNEVLAVNNVDDFKKLYTELSLKSSWDYCSQQMHERFTHLFVEYKDLLK
ncbi:MAG: hypothetical protein WAU11_03780 [Ignavibacteriaceae bacterium]